MAISDHKFEKQKEHDMMFSDNDDDEKFTFDWDKWWGVEEIELIE